MKKLVFIAIAVLTIASCKNNETKVNEDLVTTANSNLAVYKGEFIYTADAAVLKGKDFIYGVAIDEKMHELADKVAPVKKDDYDMVPVVVTGTLANKPEGTEGWDEILTIIDIVQVSKTPAKADVKIEDKKAKAKQTK
ncbi:MAG: hypothetical protein ACSHW7_04120 [Patiriisocius sp.]|uniref:hypothetical protein n=1 Tax=Patiriisocius sp. TaxID=2822396 RepID=UPI003EF717FC